MAPNTKLDAWLVRQDGPSSGARHLLRGGVTRIGRDPANDIAIRGEEAPMVSARHAEIRREGNSYKIYDLNSTNGTYVNGKRVSEASLESNARIHLGSEGPELSFEMGTPSSSDLDETIVLPSDVPERILSSRPAAGKKDFSGALMDREQEQLLSRAVQRARLARRMGGGNQTVNIMREVLGTAVRQSGRKFKAAIGVLVLMLVAVSAYGYWKIRDLQREKSDIDEQILKIEAAVRAGGQDSADLDDLIDRLNRYQEQARSLQDNLLFRLGAEGREQAFIEREIKTLLEEFGAEQYSVPPEFIEQVKRFIRQFQERDRRLIERVLGRGKKDLEVIRNVLEKENLPPDLAYMVLVESAFLTQHNSPAGAVGPWQFTAATARQYGMAVNDQVDERLDLEKSTRAASRYIRELILDFGSGSSVMLALAAYNLGPGRVKRAVRKVEDPIKQRNFWYLYRIRALPVETRQYVPKIIAAIIVGRNPERFGLRVGPRP